MPLLKDEFADLVYAGADIVARFSNSSTAREFQSETGEHQCCSFDNYVGTQLDKSSMASDQCRRGEGVLGSSQHLASETLQ